MTQELESPSILSRLSRDRQTARSAIRIGKSVELEAAVDVSSTGLLAVAVLVSGILLSTAVVVGVAIREKQKGRVGA